ncbi:hypothetical protein KFE25_005395 [Diacronema lutheri]|uniref:Uncharacterized protein n=1 Tax=Diacronema lutheri TaxID=2081491 RepID=A0A8J5XQB2_DIALT|nr:hypothetical protein KFE25_005395 [Diacronema lutheri]
MSTQARAAPDRFTAEGRGLQFAYQRLPAAFVLTAHDGRGARVRTGGEPMRVRMRGPAPGLAAVEDGLDGTYTVGFTAPVSGAYELLISIGHVPVAGSPFAISVRPAGRPARPGPVALELAAGGAGGASGAGGAAADDVRLRWACPDDEGGAPVVGYRLYRLGRPAAGPAAAVAGAAETELVHDSATAPLAELRVSHAALAARDAGDAPVALAAPVAPAPAALCVWPLPADTRAHLSSELWRYVVSAVNGKGESERSEPGPAPPHADADALAELGARLQRAHDGLAARAADGRAPLRELLDAVQAEGGEAFRAASAAGGVHAAATSALACAHVSRRLAALAAGSGADGDIPAVTALPADMAAALCSAADAVPILLYARCAREADATGSAGVRASEVRAALGATLGAGLAGAAGSRGGSEVVDWRAVDGALGGLEGSDALSEERLQQILIDACAPLPSALEAAERRRRAAAASRRHALLLVVARARCALGRARARLRARAASRRRALLLAAMRWLLRARAARARLRARATSGRRALLLAAAAWARAAARARAAVAVAAAAARAVKAATAHRALRQRANARLLACAVRLRGLAARARARLARAAAARAAGRRARARGALAAVAAAGAWAVMLARARRRLAAASAVAAAIARAHAARRVAALARAAGALSRAAGRARATVRATSDAAFAAAAAEAGRRRSADAARADAARAEAAAREAVELAERKRAAEQRRAAAAVRAARARRALATLRAAGAWAARLARVRAAARARGAAVAAAALRDTEAADLAARATARADARERARAERAAAATAVQAGARARAGRLRAARERAAAAERDAASALRDARLSELAELAAEATLARAYAGGRGARVRAADAPSSARGAVRAALSGLHAARATRAAAHERAWLARAAMDDAAHAAHVLRAACAAVRPPPPRTSELPPATDVSLAREAVGARGERMLVLALPHAQPAAATADAAAAAAWAPRAAVSACDVAGASDARLDARARSLGALPHDAAAGARGALVPFALCIVSARGARGVWRRRAAIALMGAPPGGGPDARPVPVGARLRDRPGGALWELADGAVWPASRLAAVPAVEAAAPRVASGVGVLHHADWHGRARAWRAPGVERAPLQPPRLAPPPLEPADRPRAPPPTVDKQYASTAAEPSRPAPLPRLHAAPADSALDAGLLCAVTARHDADARNGGHAGARALAGGIGSIIPPHAPLGWVPTRPKVGGHY